jgi:hypothetical protein
LKKDGECKKVSSPSIKSPSNVLKNSIINKLTNQFIKTLQKLIAEKRNSLFAFCEFVVGFWQSIHVLNSLNPKNILFFLKLYDCLALLS